MIQHLRLLAVNGVLSRTGRVKEMSRDLRASQIGYYLKSGRMSQDAIRRLAYLIELEECKGELEIFVSDEIDEVNKNTV